MGPGHIVGVFADIAGGQKGHIAQVVIGILLFKNVFQLNFIFQVFKTVFKADADSADTFFEQLF